MEFGVFPLRNTSTGSVTERLPDGFEIIIASPALLKIQDSVNIKYYL